MDLTGHYSNPRAPLRRLAELDLRVDDDAAACRKVVPEEKRLQAVQRRLRREDVAEMATAYEAGATATELAGLYGVHRTTAIAHLERAGVAIRRGRGLRPEEVDEAIDLYAEGWSTTRLGRRFGVSHHTVRAALRKAGVELRSHIPSHQVV